MSRKKVVFLGGKGIGAYCLRYLLDHAEVYNADVVAVGTKSNKALDAAQTVVGIAKNAAIPLLDKLDDLPSCDFIISVQYHKILKQQHIDKAAILAINLHMAPLPEYRGCNQFSFAIIDEKNIFGTTLHVMTSGIDDGDILAERRFEIEDDIWVNDLVAKTVEESKLLFVENIKNILAGSYKAVPQQNLESQRGTTYHYRNEIKNLKQIDESWPLEKKRKYVRATCMPGFEPPYSVINGVKKYYTKESF